MIKHFEVDNLCGIKSQNIKMGNCTTVNTLHLFAYIFFIYFVYSILVLLIKLRTLIIIVYTRIFGDVLHSPRLQRAIRYFVFPAHQATPFFLEKLAVVETCQLIGLQTKQLLIFQTRHCLFCTGINEFMARNSNSPLPFARITFGISS